MAYKYSFSLLHLIMYLIHMWENTINHFKLLLYFFMNCLHLYTLYQRVISAIERNIDERNGELWETEVLFFEYGL